MYMGFNNLIGLRGDGGYEKYFSTYIICIYSEFRTTDCYLNPENGAGPP